jgi:ketosteroid isomerase-like protein
MIELQTGHSYGVDARDRRSEAGLPRPEGARAALESFYHAFNERDIDVLRDVWTEHPLAQLNNPLGGILRGGDAVLGLYAEIFRGPARVAVEFTDIVEYIGDEHAVFAGRELGTYSLAGAPPLALSIRTTRYFRHDGESLRWRQYHHHGSIDEPDALRDYQLAVRG